MKHISFLVFILLVNIGVCQKNLKQGYLSGHVFELDNNESLTPLTGVNVFYSGTKSGTVTDTSGFFSIPFVENNYILIFSYVGYNTDTFKIKPNQEINVVMSEGKILEDKNKPDISYNQLIRPWKSRLGLVYIKNQSIYLDIQIMFFTLVALISKKTALKYINKILENLSVDKKVIEISKRKSELFPYPPPGSDKIVDIRERQDI